MAKSVQDFINRYIGKRIDDDYVCNVQCVDGFRVGCKYWGYPALPTVTGWADGYWWYRQSQGWGQYFEFVTNPKALRPGDWCFWAYGSKSCPSSHVSMFVGYTNSLKTSGEFFGENQGGNGGFTKGVISLDICGAFRPKALINTTKTTEWVTSLYKNILHRTPDSGGLTAWVNSIENGTQAKNVVSSFFYSREYTQKKTTDEQFITDCYSGYLQRKPDKSGTAHWLKTLRAKGRSAVLNGFGNSKEFKKILTKYGLR